MQLPATSGLGRVDDDRLPVAAVTRMRIAAKFAAIWFWRREFPERNLSSTRNVE
jgi:hypothetical protein